ncbi:MAG TPA: YdcF family protein [Alphaproteobacteria bacterium]
MQFILQYFNRFLVLGLAIYLLLAAAYYWQINHYPPLPAQTQVDGIVILTGGAERVDRGLEMLDKGMAHRALISGVHRDVKLRELLVLHHVSSALASRIDLGFGAIDTAGNAQETAKWVDAHAMKSLIVVTSNYHMPRAILHLRSVLPHEVTLIPASVTPDMLQRKKWYMHRDAVVLSFLAFNKYLLTWPEILLWRYKK